MGKLQDNRPQWISKHEPTNHLHCLHYCISALLIFYFISCAPGCTDVHTMYVEAQMSGDLFYHAPPFTWTLEIQTQIFVLASKCSHPLGHLRSLNCLFSQAESLLLSKSKVRLIFNILGSAPFPCLYSLTQVPRSLVGFYKLHLQHPKASQEHNNKLCQTQ